MSKNIEKKRRKGKGKKWKNEDYQNIQRVRTSVPSQPQMFQAPLHTEASPQSLSPATAELILRS